MNLMYREASLADFDAFYEALYMVDRDNAARRAMIAQEWGTFLTHAPGLTMLVEDRERPANNCIMGCVQTVFVTDAFARHVCACAAPNTNQRALERLPDNSWPLLTSAEIPAANSGVGLNALVTRWVWHEMLSDAEEQWYIRKYMERHYPRFYRGYQLKEILIPAYGDWPRQGLEAAGFKERNYFAAYYAAHPQEPMPYGHPYLLGVTREEARAQEGSYVSHLFTYTPPRIYFKPHEQELLIAALQDVSDEEAVAQLCTTKNTIKKRWNAIYDRVDAALPGILPRNTEEGRGLEKRRSLLRYLRDHPEELRPAIPRK